MTTPLERLKQVARDPIGCRADSDPIYSVRGDDLKWAIEKIEKAPEWVNILGIPSDLVPSIALWISELRVGASCDRIFWHGHHDRWVIVYHQGNNPTIHGFKLPPVTP